MHTPTLSLTHSNGRDTHRELCGFYFLSDNSITVYEFRKFGKKLVYIREFNNESTIGIHDLYHELVMHYISLPLPPSSLPPSLSLSLSLSLQVFSPTSGTT